jgi:predicted DNA-binding WGR domain protein
MRENRKGEEKMKRTFHYKDEKSNKFWSIDVEGSGFAVNYGKEGTTGQTQEKAFADEAAAKKEADKAIAEKLKKVYVEG